MKTLLTTAFLLLLWTPTWALTLPYGTVGFGSTIGGDNQPVVTVTSLADSGPGTLREALSASNRYITFAVSGTIPLLTPITLTHLANVTVDGHTADITLSGQGLIIRDSQHIVISGLRIRNAAQDGIWITDGSLRIVLNRLSISGSGDGNIDITRHDTKKITVQFCLLGTPAGEQKNMLIAEGAFKVTLWRNAFIAASQRNPQVTYDDLTFLPSPTTTLEMINNLVLGWGGGYGTRLRFGTKANVLANEYSAAGGDAEDALIVCHLPIATPDCDPHPLNPAQVYANGNVSTDNGVFPDFESTVAQPFESSTGLFPMDPLPAYQSACKVMDKAGRRPLDPIDQGFAARWADLYTNCDIFG